MISVKKQTMIRIEQTQRTIYDDFIVKVESHDEAKKVVKKFAELGFKFNASVQKYNCYYVAQRVVFDNGRPDLKLVAWGRNEVTQSNEFFKMKTYKEFIDEEHTIN